jgi:hypothetical protein
VSLTRLSCNASTFLINSQVLQYTYNRQARLKILNQYQYSHISELLLNHVDNAGSPPARSPSPWRTSGSHGPPRPIRLHHLLLLRRTNRRPLHLTTARGGGQVRPQAGIHLPRGIRPIYQPGARESSQEREGETGRGEEIGSLQDHPQEDSGKETQILIFNSCCCFSMK